MDYKKKIEIPFGAFDSELIHQEINIPNGFKAVIEGNKIILTRAESEDERIRKALIEMVHDTTGDELWVDYNVHKEEALAWLEKQGERKKCSDTCDSSMMDNKKSPYGEKRDFGYFEDKLTDDKAEPKFKVGDKIRRKAPSPCDKDMQVARIEKDYYICNHIGKFSSEVVPFSKESCYELIEQKSAEWSEEDSVRLQRIIDFLWYNRKGDTDTIYQQEQDIDWLKSLKQRIGG